MPIRLSPIRIAALALGVAHLLVLIPASRHTGAVASLILSLLPGLLILRLSTYSDRLSGAERVALAVLISWALVVVGVGVLATLALPLSRWTMLAWIDCLMVPLFALIARRGWPAASRCAGAPSGLLPVTLGVGTAIIGSFGMIGLVGATTSVPRASFVDWSIAVGPGEVVDRSAVLAPLQSNHVARMWIRIQNETQRPLHGRIEMSVDGHRTGGRQIVGLGAGKFQLERLRATVPDDGCSHRLAARLVANTESPPDLTVWTQPEQPIARCGRSN